MTQETVLVTGASGFTGSALARTLANQGVQVRAMVRKSSKLDTLQAPNITPVYCDLAGDAIPPEAMQGVDTVYNVAAVFRTQGVPDSYFFDVHVGGTQRLLEAAQGAGVRRFLHVSTVGVQGKIKNPPADENAPFAPGDIYQRSKLEGELIAMAYHQSSGFPITVVRPAGIYGPGDMRFLKLFRAINNGTFWMIGTGKNLYHFTYISDLVQGMILAAHNEQAVGEVFTIAGEEVITIAGLVEQIGQILGRPVPKRSIPVAPVMLAARVAEAVCRPFGINPPLYPRRLDFFIKDRSFDISKAKRVLGYQPEYDLRTGLACTADWYRQQGYLSRG